MGRDLCMFFIGDEKTDVVWFKINYIATISSEADITGLLAEEGINILYGYLDNKGKNENGKYVIFAQIEKEFDLEKFIEKLKALDIILDVEYSVSEKKLIHTAEFPLNLLGERAIIARARTFVDLIRMLDENVDHAEGLLVLSGVKSGTYAAKYVKGILKVDEDNFRELLKELFMAAGWGILDVEFDYKTLEGSIIVRDSFIAEVYGENEYPTCAYMSGFFAGYLTEVMGKPIHVHEIGCKGIGDEVCEHKVSPATISSRPEHVLRSEKS